MKLGISYNIFDGEELLEGSIRQIIDHVDYISVVYQIISNHGNPCSKSLIDTLYFLKKENLVNTIICYNPLKCEPMVNEINKRNIGLELSKKYKCTYHLNIDCDEYYISKEFAQAKKIVANNNYDSTACKMINYFKSWEYQIDYNIDCNVPFIHKTNGKYEFGINPLYADPTRQINITSNIYHFTRDVIQMHHGSYIRNNIRRKIENSSAKDKVSVNIDKLINSHNNVEKYGKNLSALIPGVLFGDLSNQNNIYKLNKVKPLFKTPHSCLKLGE